MTPDADHVVTVDSYLKTQPPATRRLLRLVRRSIRNAVPQAVELISYRIPAYKLTIRFPLDQPVPVDLIARIATVRAQEVDAGRRRPRVRRT